MVFAISTPTPSFVPHSSSSSSLKTSSLYVFSNYAIPIPKNSVFYHFKGIPQLGFAPFSQWNGLKHWGLSISQSSIKIERKGKCKRNGVYASLFGVGAPEALVIGVVALLVFGPKGLAEVARNLGKTLRAFQPTIRELQEVSREFKSTLEKEIGLDDIDTVPRPSPSNTPKPTPEDMTEDPKIDVGPDASATEGGEYTSDEYLKVTEAQLRGALARLQQEQEEERAREDEEKLKLEGQSDVETPTQADTPQASDDTAQVASSVEPLSQDMPEVSADTDQGASPTGASAQNAASSNAIQ